MFAQTLLDRKQIRAYKHVCRQKEHKTGYKMMCNSNIEYQLYKTAILFLPKGRHPKKMEWYSFLKSGGLSIFIYYSHLLDVLNKAPLWQTTAYGKQS